MIPFLFQALGIQEMPCTCKSKGLIKVKDLYYNKKTCIIKKNLPAKCCRSSLCLSHFIRKD